MLYLIFWFSFAVLFYCYIGYGLIVLTWNKLRNRHAPKETPGKGTILPVTLIVAAYNEAPVLEEKIRNCLAIGYPEDQLILVFVTDGSTDESPQLVKKYPRIKLLHHAERKGKYTAIKHAMRLVTTPIVVFSDANSMLNPECIERMVSHYRDPAVGAVAGEKKMLSHLHHSALGEAEGLYWQYESYLKKLDAELYTVTGAAGELYSIRTSLFRELDDNLILDDFVISMRVCLEGYKIAYEPGAFATELPSLTLAEESKRKIRISAGAYQSIGYLVGCLNFFKHPLLSFQYISRRLLRWTLCPLLLLTIAISNFLISWNSPSMLYNALLWAQGIFYFLALIGWLLVRSGKKAGWLTIPFYFVFMNVCLVRGFFKFLSGRQSVLWEKSVREGVGVKV